MVELVEMTPLFIIRHHHDWIMIEFHDCFTINNHDTDSSWLMMSPWINREILGTPWESYVYHLGQRGRHVSSPPVMSVPGKCTVPGPRTCQQWPCQVHSKNKKTYIYMYVYSINTITYTHIHIHMYMYVYMYMMYNQKCTILYVSLCVYKFN